MCVPFMYVMKPTTSCYSYWLLQYHLFKRREKNIFEVINIYLHFYCSLYFSSGFELPTDVMHFNTERSPLIYFKTYLLVINSQNLCLSVNAFLFLHL